MGDYLDLKYGNLLKQALNDGEACLRRKIMAEKWPFKYKMTKNVSFWQEIAVFYNKCQFLNKGDDFLVKYAYFLKQKNTKQRGGVPSAEIQNWKTTFLKINVPRIHFCMRVD